ncbi:hypothetical protein ASF61_16915 [Duganella sp. Leaf126]|nr:hypothetical protein ASF61_16915 [Duganella sp. Leaf126]
MVEIGGELQFHAGDVCAALGFANSRQALETHVEEDDVQKLDAIDSMGRTQLANHINEPGLYALTMGATKDVAKRFKHWVTHNVLPSIRRTGAYSVPGAPTKRIRPLLSSSLTDVRAIDFIGNMVAKVPGTRADVVAAIKLRMIEEQTGLPATQFGTALPSEALDKSVKLNPTEIGKRLAPKLSPIRVNKILIDLGLQRKSESGYVLTEAGMAHGEVHPFQAKNKHVGDQIDWYESVVEVVRAAAQRPPGGQLQLIGS